MSKLEVQMRNVEIIDRIGLDIWNAKEAMGPDGLVVLMSAALLRRLFPEFTLVAPSPEAMLFGCRVKLVPRSDLWWMVGIERNVTEEENG